MTVLSHRSPWGVLALAGVLTITLGLALASPATADSEKNLYQQHNLVSDGFVPAFLSTVAILKVDNSASDAVYKGLAIGSNASGNFLYAANFHAGTIDVFDKNFAPASLAGSFSDPNIPDGFAPFNIQNLDGQLYVTYAKQDADKRDDVAGKGNGFVTVFDTEGNFIRRIASRH